IAGESSGILFSKEAFGPVEHATTSFGQGVSVTPIQQMQAVSAAINSGTLYTPYTVSKILDSKTNEVIMVQNPEAKLQVVIEDSMVKVLHALKIIVEKSNGR